MATQTTVAAEKKAKPSLKYLRDKDREMVRGKFIFHETPGGTLKFPFRAYREDQVEKFELKDGEIYTLPLGVARHLNKNCWYPVHAYAKDENGRDIAKVGQKVRRCSFHSLEFIDIDDISPHGDLVTVEVPGI